MMTDAAHTTVVDLLRHGEAAGGRRYRGSTDDPLTADGWEQMWSALGDARPWDGIVSSPLRRCAEFATELARRHGIALELDERLREMHFGGWEGRTAEELMAADKPGLTRFWSDPVAHPPPGAELVTVFQARVLAAWDTQIAHRAGRHLLMVTHGGPIRVILGRVQGLALAGLLSLEVPLASVHRVRLQAGPEGRTALVVPTAGRLPECARS